MARQVNDHKLERAFVANVPFFGAMDLTVTNLLEVLGAEDFDDGESRRYWRAIEELVAERGYFQLTHLLQRTERSITQWEQFRGGPDVPQQLWRDELQRHAEMIADNAAARRSRLIFQSGLQLIEAETPIEDIVKVTQDRLLEVRSVVPKVALPRTLRNVVDDPSDRRFNWAVEGWIEFKDRIMITGREGGGKMTLLRQFAIQLAMGFHPWKGPNKFEPLRVMQFDLQDGQTRNEREFDVMIDRAKKVIKDSGVDPLDNVFMESRDSGLNVVRSAADRRWMEALIRVTRPHVVVVGPIYQMVVGEDRTDAVAMQSLMDFINRMRTKYDIVWMIEAHAPHGDSRAKVRDYRPFGSQVFIAWPEAGYGIVPDGRYKNPPRAMIKDWRGNRDLLTKVWPANLVWGEWFPWVPVEVAHPSLRHRDKVKNLPAPSDDDAPPPDPEEMPF